MVAEIWLPQLNKDLCTGCRDCIIICPTAALTLINGTAVLCKPSACNYCAQCEAVCPVSAIALPYQIALESLDHAEANMYQGCDTLCSDKSRH